MLQLQTKDFGKDHHITHNCCLALPFTLSLITLQRHFESEGTVPTAGVPERIPGWLCHSCVRSWRRGNIKFPALIYG
jgi:hypothetical protein